MPPPVRPPPPTRTPLLRTLLHRMRQAPPPHLHLPSPPPRHRARPPRSNSAPRPKGRTRNEVRLERRLRRFAEPEHLQSQLRSAFRIGLPGEFVRPSPVGRPRQRRDRRPFLVRTA